MMEYSSYRVVDSSDLFDCRLEEVASDIRVDINAER